MFLSYPSSFVFLLCEQQQSILIKYVPACVQGYFNLPLLKWKYLVIGDILAWLTKMYYYL